MVHILLANLKISFPYLANIVLKYPYGLCITLAPWARWIRRSCEDDWNCNNVTRDVRIFSFTVRTQLLVATILIPWRWFFEGLHPAVRYVNKYYVLHNLDNFITEWLFFKYISIYIKETTRTLGSSLLFLFDIGYTSKSGIILTLQISIVFSPSHFFCFSYQTNRCCVTLDGDHYRYSSFTGQLSWRAHVNEFAFQIAVICFL